MEPPSTGSFYFRNYDFENAWRAISKVVDSIMGLGTAGLINSEEWCDAFYQIYMMHMCFEDPYGANFYSRVADHFRAFAAKVLEALRPLDSIEFSEKYRTEWEKYCLATTYINRLFDSFNRSLRKLKSGLVPMKNSDSESQNIDVSQFHEISDLMLECWGSVIIENIRDKINENFAIYFQEIIEDESDSVTFRRLPLVKAFAASIHTTGQKSVHNNSPDCSPNNDFEDNNLMKLIKERAEFVRLKWFDNYESENFDDYLSKLSKYLSKIFVITSNVLDENTEFLRSLRQKLADLIIDRRQKEIVQNFQKNLIAKGEYSILQKIYKISLDSDKLRSCLISSFSNYILQESRKIFTSNLYKADSLCETLLNFHNNFKSLISDNLENDTDFYNKLDAGIQASVNHVESDKLFLFKLSAYFMSLIMKENDFSVDVRHKHLEVLFLMYAHLSHKDVLHKNLHYFIGKKLILTHPANPNISALLPLQMHIKEEFFRTVEASLQDYTSGYDADESFGRISVGLANFQYKFNVLRSHVWGFDPTSFEPTYSQELSRLLKEFHNYYSTQNDFRKLKYVHSESFGSVKYDINGNSYVLEVNGYQLTLLNHLMENSKSIDQIVGLTKLTERQIFENLNPMINVKMIIYSEENKIFNLNTQFSNSNTYFNFNKVSNIPPLLVNFIPVKRSRSPGIFDSENNPLIYLLSRTIKAVKHVERNALIELVKVNKYDILVTPEDVDVQLECLIKKDVIMRDSQNPNLFIYLE